MLRSVWIINDQKVRREFEISRHSWRPMSLNHSFPEFLVSLLSLNRLVELHSNFNPLFGFVFSNLLRVQYSWGFLGRQSFLEKYVLSRCYRWNNAQNSPILQCSNGKGMTSTIHGEKDSSMRACITQCMVFLLIWNTLVFRQMLFSE